MGAAGAVSLEEDLDGASPDPGMQKLSQAVMAEAEVAVEMTLCVGDCPSLRPEVVKEFAAGLRCALDEKQDAGKIGTSLRQPPQFLNLLPAEWSPEVAQESQQGRPTGNLIGQGARHQVHTGDRPVQECLRQMSHGSSRMERSGGEPAWQAVGSRGEL